MICFRVQGNPRPQLRPRATARGKIAKVYKNPRTRKDQEAFLAAAMAYAPDEPMTAPLVVDLRFAMKRPKAAKGLQLHAKKPDLDNLIKLVLDALNGVFWEDDKQIIEVCASKHYDDDPGTLVRIQSRG